MNIIEKYAGFWPPLAGAFVFVLLGLLLWLISSRAMERSKKQLSWVRRYRKAGYPFAADNLEAPPLRWYGVLIVAAAGAGFAVLYQMNTSMSLLNNWTLMLRSRYTLFRVVLSALGAAGLFVLVRTLLGSPLTAALGAMLFITAPRPGYEPCCLMALCLLFFLLYLRGEKAGFAWELLYLAGVGFYVMCLALWQELVWLAPFVVALHWYKLHWLRKSGKLTGGSLALRLICALAGWAVLAALCALLRVFLLAGFHMYQLRRFDSMGDFTKAFRELIALIGKYAFKAPMRSLVLDPMIAAPVLGLGFWGLIFAISQLRKRKSVRAAFVLCTAAAFGLTWLLTGASVLLLPLTLGACFLLRGAIAGGKTRLAVAICLLGVLFHLAIAVGAWYLPMNTELRFRML